MNESDWAHALRRFFEASDYAPEGAELWDWLWVPNTFYSVCIPLPVEQSCLFVSGDLPPVHQFPTVLVRPDLTATPPPHMAHLPVGRLGWSREARTVVLFMGKGGRFSPRTPISNGRIGALADEGQRIRCTESMRRLSEMIQQFRDEHGLAEGEEWKRD